MSEEDPFAAFKEGQPPTTEVPAAAKAKKPRKKKAAKVNGEKPPAKAAADTPTPPKPKKTRKPRAPKEVKLPISALLEVGALKGDEAGALISIATGLQKLPKRSRGKIVVALGKIFA